MTFGPLGEPIISKLYLVLAASSIGLTFSTKQARAMRSMRAPTSGAALVIFESSPTAGGWPYRPHDQ